MSSCSMQQRATGITSAGLQRNLCVPINPCVSGSTAFTSPITITGTGATTTGVASRQTVTSGVQEFFGGVEQTAQQAYRSVADTTASVFAVPQGTASQTGGGGGGAWGVFLIIIGIIIIVIVIIWIFSMRNNVTTVYRGCRTNLDCPEGMRCGNGVCYPDLFGVPAAHQVTSTAVVVPPQISPVNYGTTVLGSNSTTPTSAVVYPSTVITPRTSSSTGSSSSSIVVAARTPNNKANTYGYSSTAAASCLPCAAAAQKMQQQQQQGSQVNNNNGMATAGTSTRQQSLNKNMDNTAASAAIYANTGGLPTANGTMESYQQLEYNAARIACGNILPKDRDANLVHYADAPVCSYVQIDGQVIALKDPLSVDNGMIAPMTSYDNKKSPLPLSLGIVEDVSMLGPSCAASQAIHAATPLSSAYSTNPWY